jgi:glyceraldehyde 3-phosphate dehydrogenase
MTVRVGINGFGRIGRNFFRAAKQSGADLDFVAVNDLGSLDTMAHLLKYDSVLGVLPNEIAATGDGISVDGDVLKVGWARRSTIMSRMTIATLWSPCSRLR